MPRDNGKRVVEGARHLSPALGDRMMASTFLGRSVVLRELMPQDLKLEIDQLSRAQAVDAARYPGRGGGESARTANGLRHAARVCARIESPTGIAARCALLALVKRHGARVDSRGCLPGPLSDIRVGLTRAWARS